MKENYYRLARKQRKTRNTRLWLLIGIAVVVSVGVIAAAAVMDSALKGNGDTTSFVAKNPSSGSKENSSKKISSLYQVSSKVPVSSVVPPSSAAALSSRKAVSSAASTVTNQTSSTPLEEQTAFNTLKAGYDFTKSVGESKAVADSFFKDAAVIGDSRAAGLMGYMGSKMAKSYAKVSCTADAVLTGGSKGNFKLNNAAGQKVTILEHIQGEKNKYKKVYIMMGVNEIGYGSYPAVMQKYGQIVDGIKNSQAGVDIYLQAVLPITKKTDQKHGYLRMAKIKEFNTLLQNLAKEKSVYFIDPSSVFLGEDGYMLDTARASDKTLDGEIHFNKEYYLKWQDYLKTHTVQ